MNGEGRRGVSRGGLLCVASLRAALAAPRLEAEGRAEAEEEARREVGAVAARDAGHQGPERSA
jgi:hypothetical protein